MAKLHLFLPLLFTSSCQLFASDDLPLKLTTGFIYKLRCEGRLLISAVGDESLLRLDPLPKDSGCGAILKPMGPTGVTNLLLETSSGSIGRTVEVSNPSPRRQTSPQLEFFLKSKAQALSEEVLK